MNDDDSADLSRRLHWDPEREPEPEPHGPRLDPDPARIADEWDDEAAAATSVNAVSFEQRDLDRIEDEALDRRRQLWRDTALILSAILTAVLVANFVFPSLAGTAIASPTPGATEVTIGPTGDPGQAGATDEPILDPSLGIDATATPGPARTLPPTGTAAPTHPGATPPGATPRPTSTPTKPPPTPTPEPTPTPTPEPTPTPDVTPPPAAPHADFTWSQELGSFVVDFSDASTGEIDSWSWDFGDGGSSTGRNPNHDYGLPGIWQVTLTVSGPGGQDSVTLPVTVV